MKFKLTDTNLIITISKSELLIAVEEGRGYGLGDIVLTDKELFLKELLNELKSESEDGSNMIHEMLDKATSNAIENGAEGVEYID